MMVNRLVSENITFGLSLECFPIIFGAFFEILGFSEKNRFWGLGTVYKMTEISEFIHVTF